MSSYTHDEVRTAANAAADLITTELDLGEHDTDLLNLIVNATLTLLDRPEATLDEVIEANYSDSPATVRGWWGGWD